MHIGILCYPTVGGSGTVATELAFVLMENGHFVHLFSYAQPYRLQRPLSADQALHTHIVELPEYPLFQNFPHYDFALTAQIASAIDEYQLDLLHAHYAFPFGLIALNASAMSQRKPSVFVTLHGTDIVYLAERAEFYPLMEYTLKHSAGISAVSDYLVQRTLQLFPHLNITRIHNFVDHRFFRRTKPVPLLSELRKKGYFILIHISNLRRVKRAPETVEVFARIREKIPSYLFILGEGPEEYDVRRKAKELGIAEFVRCEGIQLNIPQYLSGSDILLLLSSEESFGLVALEALSCSVPVVATRVGGIPEVVDASCGVLVENWQEAAEAVLELHSSQERFQKMKKFARTRAIQHFSFSRIFPQYSAWYKNALKKYSGKIPSK